MEKGIIYFTAPPSSPPPCVAPPHCPPPSMRIVSWLPLAHVQMVLKWNEGCEAFQYTPASPYCLWRGATVNYRNPLLFLYLPFVTSAHLLRAQFKEKRKARFTTTIHKWRTYVFYLYIQK
jgi:hypothetical protein